MTEDEKSIIKAYFINACLQKDSDIESTLSAYLTADIMREKHFRAEKLSVLTAQKETLCKCCNDIFALLHL